MQTSSGTNVGKDSSSGTAVPPQERDEDSGLHDIRSMASSAKLRINSRRTSTAPPMDEDILASSSAGWKAVALPEPARMVSLPEIDSLPSVDEVKSDRKSKKELKAERTSAAKIAKEAIAVETAPISASISPAPVAKQIAAAPALEAKVDVPATPIIGARFAQQAKQKKASSGSRTGLYAALGLGLAAAAGVGWYVSTQMNNTPAAQVASNDGVAQQERVRAQSAPAAGSAAVVAAPTVEPIAPPAEPPKEETVVATGMATDGAPGGDNSKADEGASAKPRAKAGTGKKKDDKDRGMVFVDKTETKPEVKPVDKKAEGGEGEPSFDALLKEAGVQDKKPVKVTLEKKSLSGADIKKGMSGIGGKAQACYAGTQGTAQVKLTVSPDGAVKSVAVTGVFAGTPVGACVEKAVKSASFPAWDGGPQSFGYSYLLAE